VHEIRPGKHAEGSEEARLAGCLSLCAVGQEQRRREAAAAGKLTQPVQSLAVVPGLVNDHGVIALREEFGGEDARHIGRPHHQFSLRPCARHMLPQQPLAIRIFDDQQQPHGCVSPTRIGAVS
jgi:hypothetical protein